MVAFPCWVGGTGTWDAVTTTHWSASSGGVGGAPVPVPGDIVTFDANSGGGTVTVNTNIDVSGIDMGAFAGTLDFATNNNNVSLTTLMSLTGTGVRTLNMGNGTWTFPNGGTIWNCSNATNLTLNANSSVISLPTYSGNRNFIGAVNGVPLYNSFVIDTNSSGGGLVTFSGANKFTTFSVGGNNIIEFPSGITQFITNGMTWTGTPSSQIRLESTVPGLGTTISSANNHTFTWAQFANIAFTGGGVNSATNSFKYASVSGITVTNPSAGGSSGQFFSASFF